MSREKFIAGKQKRRSPLLRYPGVSFGSSPPETRTNLESVVHSELQNAGYCSGVVDAAEVGCIDVGIHARRHEEAWVVGGVDRFGAELQGVTFANGHALQDRQVELEQSRTVKLAALESAESARSGVEERLAGEGRGAVGRDTSTVARVDG
jgi:hypothetical protein